MQNRPTFRKWNRWLKVIERELRELVIHNALFHQFIDATNRYIGVANAWPMATWMAQGSYVYQCIAIRRLTEPWKKNTPKNREYISLAVLLHDLIEHPDIITRSRHRKMYRTALRHLPQRIGMRAGDNAFALVSGDGAATTVSATRMQTDLADLRRVSKRVNERVNKVHAHVERDRRRIGKAIGLAEIDATQKVLLEIHYRYALMIQGRDVRNIMTAEGFDIRKDLDRIWPSRT